MHPPPLPFVSGHHLTHAPPPLFEDVMYERPQSCPGIFGEIIGNFDCLSSNSRNMITVCKLMVCKAWRFCVLQNALQKSDVSSKWRTSRPSIFSRSAQKTVHSITHLTEVRPYYGSCTLNWASLKLCTNTWHYGYGYLSALIDCIVPRISMDVSSICFTLLLLYIIGL